jgi:hypothetical protein
MNAPHSRCSSAATPACRAPSPRGPVASHPARGRPRSAALPPAAHQQRSAYCFEEMRLCGSASHQQRIAGPGAAPLCRAPRFATPSLCTLSIVRYLPHYQVSTAFLSLSSFFYFFCVKRCYKNYFLYMSSINRWQPGTSSRKTRVLWYWAHLCCVSQLCFSHVIMSHSAQVPHVSHAPQPMAPRFIRAQPFYLFGAQVILIASWKHTNQLNYPH